MHTSADQSLGLHASYLGASRVGANVFEDAINSLQQVLSKYMPDNLAPVGQAVTLHLSVDGINIDYHDTSHPNLFLPMKFFLYCGAIRKLASTPLDPGKRIFETLNRIQPEVKTLDPPLFIVVYKGIGTFIAHTFSVLDDQTALNAVNGAMRFYYQHENMSEISNTIEGSFNWERHIPTVMSRQHPVLGDATVPSAFTKFTQHTQGDLQSLPDRVGFQQPQQSILQRHLHLHQPAEWNGTSWNQGQRLDAPPQLHPITHDLNPIANTRYDFPPSSTAIMQQHIASPPASTQYQYHPTAGSDAAQYIIRYDDGTVLSRKEIQNDSVLRNILQQVRQQHHPVEPRASTDSNNGYIIRRSGSDQSSSSSSSSGSSSGSRSFEISNTPGLYRQQSRGHDGPMIYNGNCNAAEGYEDRSQNVIIRWIQADESGGSPVVVVEQRHQINRTGEQQSIPPKPIIIRDESNGGPMSDDPQTIIIERSIQPPSGTKSCPTTAGPGRIVIPITVNEMKLIRPNPIVVEHLRPVYKTRRRTERGPRSVPRINYQPASYVC